MENPFSCREADGRGLEGCPSLRALGHEILVRIAERRHRLVVVHGVPRPIAGDFTHTLVEEGQRGEHEVLSLDMSGPIPSTMPSVQAYRQSLTRGQELLGSVNKAAAASSKLLVLIRDAHLLANLHLQHLIRLAARREKAGSGLVLVLMGEQSLVGRLGETDATGDAATLAPWIFDAAPHYAGAVRAFVVACLRRAGTDSPVFGEDAVAALAGWAGCTAESLRVLCGWAYLLSLRDGLDAVDARLIQEAAALCGLSRGDDQAICTPFPTGEVAIEFLRRQHRGQGEQRDAADRVPALAWRLRQGRGRLAGTAPATVGRDTAVAVATEGASESAVPGQASSGAGDDGTPLPPSRAPRPASAVADPKRLPEGPKAPSTGDRAGGGEILVESVAGAPASRDAPPQPGGGWEIGVGSLRLRPRFHHLAAVVGALLLGIWLSTVFFGGHTQGQGGGHREDPLLSRESHLDGTGSGPLPVAADQGPHGAGADPEALEPGVDALIALAEQQVRAQKLTTPAGDNALESYLAVLRLRPGYRPALDGLGRIRTQYEAWASVATERKDSAKASRYLHKALVVSGVHEREMGAQDNIITWVGCGVTKKAFMKELAEAFERKTGIRVILEGGGASRGIRDTANSVVQMGGSCRMALPLVDPDELHVTLHPVAWDALTVIVNPDNPLGDISSEQIRRIYRGEIRDWGELGGPDGPIHLCVRYGKTSGVGYAIRQYLFRDANVDFVTDPSHVFPSSGPLEQAIERDPLAIGITGVSSARKRQVGILAIDGDRPTFEDMVAGRYKFYRPLYLVTRERPTGNVKALVDFALSPEGEDVIRANGTVPYLDAPQLAAKVLVHGFGVN